MQKYRNRIITGVVIVFSVYILLLVIFDSSGQLTQGVGDAIRQFPLWLIPILCLTQLSAGFFRFLEWHYYLGVIDARDKISLKDSVIIFTSAFTMTVSPGKLAELLKAVFLKLKTDVPITKSAPVVLAERVVDGLAVIVCLLIILLFSREQLNLGDYENIAEGIIYLSTFLLVTGLIVVQIKPLAYLCLNLLGKVPFIRRFQQPLTEFYDSTYEVFKLRHLIPTTTMGIGVYLSSTVGFILILWGFGVEVTGTLFVQAAFIVGVASAIGALSFVPNGAGVTEISTVAMLTAIVAPSNPALTPPIIAASALIQGFFHKWFRVIVGAGVAFAYRKRLFTAELEQEIQAMDGQKRHPQETVAV